MFSLKNKVAVITGGGSGIGRSIACIFARQGAVVFVLDVDENRSLETINEINKEGGKAVFKKCSVAMREQVDEVIESIIEDRKKIDIIINSAGIANVGTIETTEDADLERLISVNVRGAYYIIQATIPHLKIEGGVILNVASVAALVGLPDRFAYSLTKGAVIGMTLSIARDYLSYNIRCNSISPARVHTSFVDGFLAKNYPGQEKEMFQKLSATQPIGRMAKPEEVAYLALYLCSDEASFVTGCDYPIDGGFVKLNN